MSTAAARRRVAPAAASPLASPAGAAARSRAARGPAAARPLAAPAGATARSLASPAGAAARSLASPAGAIALGLAAFVAASHLEAAVSAVLAGSAGVGAVGLAAAVVAAGWAVRVARAPSRGLLLAGAAGAVALAGLWMWTRSLGLPFDGTSARAPVGVLDTITAFDELLLAWFAIAAARSLDRPAGERWPVLGCVAISLSFVALAMGCAPPASAAGDRAPSSGSPLICHLY